MLRAGRRLPERLKLAPISLLIGAAIGQFAIHTVEIWSFAALYLLLKAAPDFEQGLHFSTVTYASIGYGDVLMAKPWRILGAIEGATGVIMLGWSTAFLVSLLAQSRLLGHDWLTVEPERGRSARRSSAERSGQLILERPGRKGRCQPGPAACYPGSDGLIRFARLGC